MKHALLLLFLCALAPDSLRAQDDPWGDEDWDDEEQASAWSGFVEAGFGRRFNADPLLDSPHTLGEIRWRLESAWQPGRYTIGLKADAAWDGIEGQWTGELRDLTLAFTAGASTDFKIGRQVQTWGTGDLLFLNDLFPKDFVSFFAGREDEYLKAPGNALRISRYGPAINVDFSWTPVFEPDVYLTGERFSFFSPLAGGNVAPDPPLSAIEPEETFANGEFAVRLFRNVEGRLAERLTGVGRVHLMCLAVAELRRSLRGFPERPIKSGGVLHRVGHDRQVLKTNLIKRRPDRRNHPVHHPAWGNEVRSRLRMRHGHPAENLQGLVVQNVPLGQVRMRDRPDSAVDQSAMTMIGVFTKTHVGDDDQVRPFGLDGPHGLLDDTVRRVVFFADGVLTLRNAEENQRPYPAFRGAPHFIQNAVERPLVYAGH